MPLNIRDAEVDRLARQLAALNQTTKTQAVKDALRRELAQLAQICGCGLGKSMR